MAQVAQASMAMNNLDLFPNDNVPEQGEEGEDGGKGGLAIYDEKGYMVDFKAIGEISNTCPASVCVGNDNDFMASINEFLAEG